jgi:peptidyl-prolyl cis-trans isomerase B (cyclophilin B)
MKKHRLGLVFLILFLFVTGEGGCSSMSAVKVLFETSKGDITIELYPDKAPDTVKNFLAYVESGFYNFTIFHRVIPGFMAQGGGFEKGLKKKDTREPIKNEASNGLSNSRGTIAMARTSDPHSATGQFFINVVDNKPLNYKSSTEEGYGYCVFGKVTEGMDVVDAIVSVPTKTVGMYQNVPVQDVVILKATKVK